MTLEKRRYPRRSFSRLAGVEMTGGNIRLGIIGNISKSGMLLKTRERLPKRRHYRFFIADGPKMTEIAGRALQCIKAKDLYDIRIAFDKIVNLHH